MPDINLVSAAEVKVIKRHEGGGGIVEIPLIVEHQKFDYSRTTGGGPENGSISMDMLHEMAANFPLHPNVPIGVAPHVEYGDRAGLSPGFIDSVRVVGGELIGICDLGPQLFAELVDQRGWRGFSVEARKNLKMPARDIKGWTLIGGVFTNRASTDTYFKIAAEANGSSSAELQTHRALAGAKKGHDMAEQDKALGRLEAEAKVKDDTIANLRTDLQKANETIAAVKKDAVDDAGKVAQLEGDLKTEQAKSNRLEASAKDFEGRCTKLQADLMEATAKVTAIENAGKAERIVAAIEMAIKKGIKPAQFDGHEKDPVAWLTVKWAGNLDALENMATTMLDTNDPSATSSGKDTADAADEPMTDERRKALIKLGLDPDKAGIATENDYIALKLKKKES